MKKLYFFAVGLFLGSLITLLICNLSVFKPFNFGFVETSKYKFFLQQAIELPVPTADHTTSVWLKEKNKPIGSSPWVYIGKVHTAPFNLDEVKINELDSGLNIQFPWGASLYTRNLKKWHSR